MIFTLKQIKQILGDRNIRKLLPRIKSLSLKDIEDYEKISEERKEEISEAVLDIMKAYAPIMLIYPPCDEQFPNDCEIYGIRGLYIAYYPNDNIYKIYTNKTIAVREASEVSKMFRELWNSIG